MPGRPIDTPEDFVESIVRSEDRRIAKVEATDPVQFMLDQHGDALVATVLNGANPTASASLFRTLLEFTRAKPAQETIVKGGGPMFNVVVSSIGSKESE